MKLVLRILNALPIGDGRRPFWEVVKAYIAAGRYSDAFRKVFEHSGDFDYEEQVFAVCASTLVKPFDGNVCETARALIKADDPYPGRVRIGLVYGESTFDGYGRDYGMAVQDLFLQLNAIGCDILANPKFYEALKCFAADECAMFCPQDGSMALTIDGESAAH